MDTTTMHALKHTRVYNAVKEDILTGRLRYGERLYNEKWMCESYQVSRTTLRRAIDELIEEGFLERRPNRGVYVKYSKFDPASDRPFSIFQELRKSGVVPSSKILFFSRREAGEKFARIFEVGPDERLLEIHRLRFANDKPIMINHLYFIERLFPDFNPWRLTDGSLHEILKEDYHVKIANSVQKVDAVSASKVEADLLDVAFRTPLLHTTSRVTSEDGYIVDYQETWINTRRVPYSFRFNWRGSAELNAIM